LPPHWRIAFSHRADRFRLTAPQVKRAGRPFHIRQGCRLPGHAAVSGASTVSAAARAISPPRWMAGARASSEKAHPFCSSAFFRFGMFPRGILGLRAKLRHLPAKTKMQPFWVIAFMMQTAYFKYGSRRRWICSGASRATQCYQVRGGKDN
jgi:hypothetical protein